MVNVRNSARCSSVRSADQRLTAGIAWGSPYGATVHGFDTLYAIHRRLKREDAVTSANLTGNCPRPRLN